MIGRLKPDPQIIEMIFERQQTVISEDLKSVLIGYLAYSRQPMPAKWAIQIAYTDERSRRSIVLDKCLAEFIRLFEKRYHEKFASGLVPRADGAVREHVYKPASPSLLNGTSNFSRIPIGRWPAIRSWRIQFAPVIDVWNSCIDELQSYSRRKGREGVDEYAALPASLREEVPHPRLPEWEALLASHLPEHGALLIPAGKIAEFEGVPERAKLTLAQSKSIADAAEGLGTPLEPDPRYSGKLYNWDSWIAVLRLPEKPVIPQTRNYLLAGVVLRLALEISEADGVTDEAERRTITEFINERFRLANNERLRLSALMDVLLKERTSLAGLKKLLEQNLSEPQRRMIGRFLVSVAAQSNGIETSEYRALEKMYGNLGLTVNSLSEDVAEVEFKPAEAPVRVLENEDERSEPLPQAGSVDLDRIRRLRAESEQVAEMLVTAMAETAVLDADEDHTPKVEAQQAPAPKQVPEPTSNDAHADGQFSALAPALRPIVIALLKREAWPKAEVEALARNNGTSLTAAIDGINEWADEHLGDFLVEDGDPIKVYVSRAKPLLEQA